MDRQFSRILFPLLFKHSKMFAPSVYNAYSNTPVSRSMVPWWGYRRNWTDPFDQMERWMQSMDRYYDEHMGFQMRDHAAQMKIEPNGDFTYKVDVSGFRPEEMTVEVQGNEVVITGEHREQNQGESVHRQFVRRVYIPDGIKKETVKCDMDTTGRMCVTAKQNAEGKRTIPIDFKPVNTTTTTTGGQTTQTK
uniref:SHSP domain-containing protein n=3 Tax=Meloidogyne TaxID=189290 RepID=A0A914LBP0_MELIC